MVKKFIKNRKGFTLIELVVVVAILGVLATLVVPNVINRINEAKDAVLNANIKVINNAIRMYYFEKGDYPAADDVKKLIDVLKNAGYLDPHEAENAKNALDGKVDLNTNTDGKVTSIQNKDRLNQAEALPPKNNSLNKISHFC